MASSAGRSKNKRLKRRTKRLIAFIAAIFLLLGGIGSYFTVEEAMQQAVAPKGTLRVHFLDVDQGDAVFLELPDGKTMLIDAGTVEEGSRVIEHISSLGYSKIDYLVASHPHSDHIGGLPAIIKKYDIGEVWAPRVSHTTQSYEAFLDAVSSKNLKIKTVWTGKEIYSSNGCWATVLSPAEGSAYDELNDWSAVIRLNFGETSFLFTGDASASVILSAVDSNIDVLKVSHHGSYTGTDKQLVSRLSPTYAIISCGTGNTYGHPHNSVLSLLKDSVIYRTDLDGTIEATSNGTEITFSTEAAVVG